MKDHRWESLDAADESFVESALRAGREELPDDARLRAIEGRLGSALEKEPPPSGWWSWSRLYPIVGLAIVAIGVRAGSSLLAEPSSSVVPATPTAPAISEAAPSVESAAAIPASVSVESSSGVSVESLPSAEPPAAQPVKLTSTPEPKARPSAASAVAAVNAPNDELALLEEASRALDASPGKTLALTDEHAKRFRTPKFAQERERLAIVALVRLGRRDEAKRRADAFEAAFPGSAHLTRIRELVRP